MPVIKTVLWKCHLLL